MKSPAINDLTSAVFDNGHRGAPRPGCDCVQCFGYCMIDRDHAYREIRSKFERVGRAPRYSDPLDFDKELPLAKEPQ